MKLLVIFLLTLNIFTTAYAATDAKETSIKHFDIPDVTSFKEAQFIFTEKTSELKNKKVLNVDELQQIHMITYTLEKSIEFFVLNLEGEKKSLAEKAAEIVENIHINSENNRKEKTEVYLNNYFDLASKLESIL